MCDLTVCVIAAAMARTGQNSRLILDDAAEMGADQAYRAETTRSVDQHGWYGGYQCSRINRVICFWSDFEFLWWRRRGLETQEANQNSQAYQTADC